MSAFPSSARRVLSLAVVNAFVALGLVLLLEGAARLLTDDTNPGLFSDRELRIRGRPYVVAHDTRGFALQPSYRGQGLTVNSMGFRSPEPSRSTEKSPTVLVLGESTVFGWKVADGEDLPSRLDARLGDQGFGTVSVVNGGVPAYTSSQVLLTLDEILENGEIPVDLVLVDIMWNDLWYSGASSWYPELLVFQQPARWRAFLVEHSRLFRLAVMRKVRWRDRVDITSERALEHYGNNLAAMAAAAAGEGVPIAFVEPPFSPALVPPDGLGMLQTWYTRRYFLDLAGRYGALLEEKAAEAGVPLIAHRLGLSGEGDRDLFLDFSHPSAEGYDLIAGDVARHLSESGFLPREGAASGE